jgi:hypothetical protein
MGGHSNPAHTTRRNPMKKRMLFHVILLLTLTWGGFSGCGGDEIVSPTGTVEAEEVTDQYVGDNIYFKVGGTFNEGYVVEGVSADEVKVRLDDGNTKTISLDSVRGTRLVAHPDLEVVVTILGDRDQGEELLVGRIAGVYTDGMRKIKIINIEFMDDRREVLDVPLIRFVHEDTDFKYGGYLTLEEYKELLKKLNNFL